MNLDPNAIALTESIKKRETTATATIAATLEKITRRNPELNCFTEILTERAIAKAQKIDEEIETGKQLGKLAGVPFAVKNLFDIQGITTLAGSKIERNKPPATRNATAIDRLEAEGAILVGALNMDEYAYGFVTENTHYGSTRNPHDVTRIAGGSSGGSASAVAANLVPFSLGSDTNGSVRVPAGLCGVYGLKPTYGRLSRRGAFLFASSLDCIGVFANSLADTALTFDILQGKDPEDPICSDREPISCLAELDKGIGGLRIAVAGGYFSMGAMPEAIAAVETVANKLNVTQRVTIPDSDRAKAAAYIITASEGAELHLKNLQARPQDFDPKTRDRFLAGTLIPNSWYIKAQKFRSYYRRQLQKIWQEIDIILAPTTPHSATEIGRETIAIDGEEILIRPHLGRFTQPISFVGLPVLSIPAIQIHELPLGVQIIAAPHAEHLIMRVARTLEKQKDTSNIDR